MADESTDIATELSADALGLVAENVDLEAVLAAWHTATLRLERTHETLCGEVARLTKELEIKKLEKEIEALRIVLPIVAEAGTVNPGGRSGVSASVLARTVVAIGPSGSLSSSGRAGRAQGSSTPFAATRSPAPSWKREGSAGTRPAWSRRGRSCSWWS